MTDHILLSFKKLIGLSDPKLYPSTLPRDLHQQLLDYLLTDHSNIVQLSCESILYSLKNLLQLFNKQTYLGYMSQNLHQYLLNYLFNGIKCTSDKYTWTYYYLKVNDNEFRICGDSISRLWKWTFNKNDYGNCPFTCSGSYDYTSQRYYFERNSNTLHIGSCYDHDMNMYLSQIETLIMLYKIFRLYNERIKYIKFMNTIKSEF